MIQGRKLISKKLWFTIHGWLGAQLGVLLFVVLFSGAFATISNEMDWLLNPAMRVTPQGELVGYSVMSEAVEAKYPDRRISRIKAPLGDRFAAEFLVERTDGSEFPENTARVYVNPYTGAVQGTAGWFNVQRTLRNFHMSLSLPSFGIYIVGSFGFFLLTSIVTGLLFYKNWRRGLFELPVRGGRRALWSGVHRTAGLWSLWFTFIIAATGIWYFVEMGMFDAGVGLGDVPKPPPMIPEEKFEQYGRDPAPLPLDELIRAAQAAFPDFRAASVYYPPDPRGAVDFTGDGEAWLVRPRANRVFVNPYDGAVMAVYRGEELPLAYRWVHTADPLHFGDFGGLATKLIWFAFGLLSSGLTLTGVYVWFQRNRRRADQLATEGRARIKEAAA